MSARANAQTDTHTKVRHSIELGHLHGSSRGAVMSRRVVNEQGGLSVRFDAMKCVSVAVVVSSLLCAAVQPIIDPSPAGPTLRSTTGAAAARSVLHCFGLAGLAGVRSSWLDDTAAACAHV